MIYDKNPPYPHYDHLPYAKEPWKSLYVFQRLFTTLALVPVWVVYYLIVPRTYRPRASWNLRQIINVKFKRRIFKVTEVAGVTWGTRDPTVAPSERSLSETRFEWVDPLPPQMRTGIVDNKEVPFTRVGCYIWPKNSNESLDAAMENGAAESGRVPLVGVFMHGGGYCHMSAHESSGPSRVPRNLIKRGILQKVYSVEYRLLQNAPFPAVVQDASAVYRHVVETYAARNQKCKIILIGDSSGGNLVLALTRWIRDERHLPLPHGLLLLSPSCDTTSALPATLSSYIPRPNKHTDYLVDTPEPRALLQRTFLGFKYHDGPATQEEEKRLMEIVHSEYVSPCSPAVLKRWGHEVKQDPEGTMRKSFIRDVLKRLPTTMRITHDVETLEQLPKPVSSLSPQKMTSSSSIGFEDTPLLVDPTVNAGPAVSIPLPSSIEQAGSGSSTNSKTSEHTKSPLYLPQPTHTFPALFSEFPKTLIVCGDAERLVREVRSLISAMQKDGVDLDICWAPDACHDLLIISDWWWDRRVLEAVWAQIGHWAGAFSGLVNPSDSKMALGFGVF